MPRNPLIERHSILKFGIDPDLAAHIARVAALPRNQAVDVGRAAPVVAYLKANLVEGTSIRLWDRVKFVWSDFLGWQRDADNASHVEKITGLKGQDIANNYAAAGGTARSSMVSNADYGQASAVQAATLQTDQAFAIPVGSTLLLRMNATATSFAPILGDLQRDTILGITPAGDLYGRDKDYANYGLAYPLQAGWQNLKVDFLSDRTIFKTNNRPSATLFHALAPSSGFALVTQRYRDIVLTDTVLTDAQAGRIFQALGDNTPAQGRVGDIITPNDARISANAWTLVGAGGATRGGGYLQASDPAATWQVTSGCNGLRLWYKTAGSFRYRLNENAWQQQAGNDTWQSLELLGMPAGYYTLQVQPVSGATQLENLDVL